MCVYNIPLHMNVSDSEVLSNYQQLWIVCRVQFHICRKQCA